MIRVACKAKDLSRIVREAIEQIEQERKSK